MNKYIFITGATSGLGLAFAEIFAKNGWNLIITGRRKERLEKLSENLITQYNTKIEILNFDVSNRLEVANYVESLPSQVKSNIEILINNAGQAAGLSSIDNGLLEDWETMIDTNLKGVLYVFKAVIPYLKANKSGHIFNISSLAGKEVYPKGNVYCATKHAVDALSKAMRIDLVEYGIKVTNIAPGAAETEFSKVRFKGDDEAAAKIYQGFKPLIAEDIAEIVYFAATRPKHVAINDLVITPTAQASMSIIHKVTI